MVCRVVVKHEYYGDGGFEETFEILGNGFSKRKGKEPTNIDYDATRFTKKIKEKLYNQVWVRNGTVIEREFHLISL